MLHERDAAALDGASDDDLRSVVNRVQLAEHTPQLVEVVAVARSHVPAERRELLLQVAEREDLLRRLVGLELVAVDDDRESRLPVVRCALQRLEVLALLQLAVADHHHDAAAPPQLPLGPGDAAALRDAHAQRAGVGLDARRAHVGMTVQPTGAPQPQELLAWARSRASAAPHTGRERHALSTEK